MPGCQCARTLARGRESEGGAGLVKLVYLLRRVISGAGPRREVRLEVVIRDGVAVGDGVGRMGSV